MLDYLLRYTRSRSGQKSVLDAIVVYSRDLNLRTNYFSIVSFRLYAWKIRHSRHGTEKAWETSGCNFASIHNFSSDIALFHIDETPVKVGI